MKFHLVQKTCSAGAERYPSPAKNLHRLSPLSPQILRRVCLKVHDAARRCDQRASMLGKCGKHGSEEDGEDSEAEAYVSDVKFNSIDHAGAACSDVVCPHPS